MNIIAISDTHGLHREILDMPKGDVIIHSGDFSSFGDNSFYDFLDWFSSLEFNYKILISGNHEKKIEEMGYEKFFILCKSYGITYLQDSYIKIDNLKFYGSPWTIEYKNWAFMKNEDELKSIWENIDKDTDILITHSPIIKNIGDKKIGENMGSVSLSEKIKKLSLKVHIFGHDHNNYGIYKTDEKCLLANAALLDEEHNLKSKKPLLINI